MSSLYDLTGDFLKVMQMAEDGDIDEQTFSDTLESINAEIEVKADGYAKIIKMLDGIAKAIKDEEDRLAKRRKAIENKIELLKRNLEKCMTITGKLNFKTLLFSFRIQKNAPALKLDDIDIHKVPMKFRKQPEIDKAAVKEALKNGIKLKWARLEQSESIRIV